MVSNYKGRKLSTEPIKELTRCEVFVFGSNLEANTEEALQDMLAAILVQPLDKALGHKDNAMRFQPCSKQ